MSGEYYIVEEGDREGAVTMLVNPLAPNDPSDNTTLTTWSDSAAAMSLMGGLSQTARDDMLFHAWPEPPAGRYEPDGWYCSFCEQAETFDGGVSLDGLWVVERLCPPCAKIALRYCRMYAFTDAPLLVC